ncbi:MAG TPA: ABC transporter permease subunit [Albitalea sp.]|nr:ABC transporter permease subunit [Albitalea sp.]
MNFALEPRQVGIVAAKEFRDRIRNRWVLAVTIVFTLFALAIAYVGAAQQGQVGLRGIDVTIASLVSLAIYLLPLISLILGFDAIVGERERGSLDLLLAMPITRLELLLGKFIGLSAALACSTVAGFGLVGALLAVKLPGAALYHYAGFVLSAVLLGVAFLSLAVTVSVFAVDRARASGAAIGLWFFFVLVFDLLLLGALVVGGGKVGGGVFPYLLLLNPADVFRILNIFGLDELRTLYGLATVFPEQLASPLLLGAVMLAWITAPLGLAAWKFRR